MKTKSLKKLGLNKLTITQLNKKEVNSIKGKGTCGCISYEFTCRQQQA